MDELKGKRIFIVEDDHTNMAVNAVVLKSSGATIIQDPWTDNPIEKMKKYLPIDIVLLDLMLRHNLSGYDVFDKMQADPELANIPVVLVSASEPGIEIPVAKEKGFAGFIGKPVLPRLFPQQIAACLNGESVWYAQDGHLGSL